MAIFENSYKIDPAKKKFESSTTSLFDLVDYYVNRRSVLRSCEVASQSVQRLGTRLRNSMLRCGVLKVEDGV